MKKKGNRSFALLYAYSQLRDKNEIATNSIVERYNVSTRTAYRYISTINNYFAEEFLPYKIKYKRSINKYVLVNLIDEE